jgi:hypothetical protein
MVCRVLNDTWRPAKVMCVCECEEDAGADDDETGSQMRKEKKCDRVGGSRVVSEPDVEHPCGREVSGIDQMCMTRGETKRGIVVYC